MTAVTRTALASLPITACDAFDVRSITFCANEDDNDGFATNSNITLLLLQGFVLSFCAQAKVVPTHALQDRQAAEHEPFVQHEKIIICVDSWCFVVQLIQSFIDPSALLPICFLLNRGHSYG